MLAVVDRSFAFENFLRIEDDALVEGFLPHVACTCEVESDRQDFRGIGGVFLSKHTFVSLLVDNGVVVIAFPTAAEDFVLIFPHGCSRRPSSDDVPEEYSTTLKF